MVYKMIINNLKRYQLVILSYVCIEFIIRYFISKVLPAANIMLSRAVLFSAMGTLADLFPVLLLCWLFRMTKKKAFIYISGVWIIIAVFLTLLNFILIKCTLNILDGTSFFLFVDNLNGESIRGILGANYYIYFGSLVFATIFIFKKIFISFKEISRIDIKNKGGLLALIIVLCLYCNMPNFYPQVGRLTAYDLRGWVWQPSLYTIAEIFHYMNNSKEACSYNEDKYVLTDVEQEELIKSGVYNRKKFKKNLNFNKIIFVVVESLDKNYIHFYNSIIPKGTTDFLDFCASTYPSLENYFTASTSTDNGINALFCSRLDYYKDRAKYTKEKNQNSLFSVLRKSGYKSYFIRGTSKVYGDHNIYYNNLFNMDFFITAEDFSRKYDIRFKQWGVTDDYLFDEALDVIEKNEKQIVVINTIDTHYPYRDYEETVFKSKFLNAIYFLDKNLERFYKQLKKRNLLKKDVLMIITADHSSIGGENYTKRTDLKPDRIPLIFITDNKWLISTLDEKKYCSAIDVAPTILSLFGADIPEEMMGSNILTKDSVSITKYQDELIVRRPSEIDKVRLDQESIYQKWYRKY